MMSSFRIETVMKGLCMVIIHLCSLANFSIRVAIYFLLHGIKLFLKHWKESFIRSYLVLASR